MERILSAIILVILAGLLTGCNEAARTDISKLSDLAQTQRENQKRVVSAGFYIYPFEVDANEFSLISETFTETGDPEMKFNITDVFTDNGFAVAGGQRDDWAELGEKLLLTHARKTETISLMVYEDIGNDIATGILKDTQKVFCKISDNKFFYLNLGQGQPSLRLRISKVVGLLGVCRVDITPVFIPGQIDQDGIFIRNRLIKNTVFNASTINFRIRPGQWVLFGPKNYDPEHRLLSSTFFSSKTSPTVRLVLLVCNVIRE
jgi:hypothetical protein